MAQRLLSAQGTSKKGKQREGSATLNEQEGRERPEELEQAVWQAMLCDCGKMMGRTSSPRCEVCWTHPTHGVEMRLTESSILLFSLRHLDAYKEVMGK